MLECLGAICKPGLDLLILPSRESCSAYDNGVHFITTLTKSLAGCDHSCELPHHRLELCFHKVRPREAHRDIKIPGQLPESSIHFLRSLTASTAWWNKTDCYSLTFPSKGILLEKMHVLWVHCEMQNYAGFLKNEASLAFQNSRKPAWGGGANQGQDSAAPQCSHPGNWGLWGTAWDSLARMTTVLFSHARTLFTELRAALFPGNRNKDPASSPKE